MSSDADCLTTEQTELLAHFWTLFFLACRVQPVSASESLNNPHAPARPLADRIEPFSSAGDHVHSVRDGCTHNGGYCTPMGRHEYAPSFPQDDPTMHDVQCLEYADAMRSFLEHFGGEQLRRVFWMSINRGGYPDAVFLRFLRCCRWDIQGAIDQLGAVARFRLENQIDSLIRGGEPALARTKGAYSLMRLGVCYIWGATRTGEPIYWLQVSRHVPSNQAQKEIVNVVHYYQEWLTLLMVPPVERKLIVFNLKDFGLRNMDWWTIFYIVKTVERFYPETVSNFIVWNPPWIFKPIWAILRPLLDPVVVSKVVILYTLEELDKYVPKNRVPIDALDPAKGPSHYIWPFSQEAQTTQEARTPAGQATSNPFSPALPSLSALSLDPSQKEQPDHSRPVTKRSDSLHEQQATDELFSAVNEFESATRVWLRTIHKARNKTGARCGSWDGDVNVCSASDPYIGALSTDADETLLPSSARYKTPEAQNSLVGGLSGVGEQGGSEGAAAAIATSERGGIYGGSRPSLNRMESYMSSGAQSHYHALALDDYLSDTGVMAAQAHREVAATRARMHYLELLPHLVGPNMWSKWGVTQLDGNVTWHYPAEPKQNSSAQPCMSSGPSTGSPTTPASRFDNANPSLQSSKGKMGQPAPSETHLLSPAHTNQQSSISRSDAPAADASVMQSNYLEDGTEVQVLGGAHALPGLCTVLDELDQVQSQRRCSSGAPSTWHQRTPTSNAIISGDLAPSSRNGKKPSEQIENAKSEDLVGAAAQDPHQSSHPQHHVSTTRQMCAGMPCASPQPSVSLSLSPDPHDRAQSGHEGKERNENEGQNQRETQDDSSDSFSSASESAGTSPLPREPAESPEKATRTQSDGEQEGC